MNAMPIQFAVTDKSQWPTKSQTKKLSDTLVPSDYTQVIRPSRECPTAFWFGAKVAKVSWLCAMGLLIPSSPLHAQFADRPLAGEVAERKIEQLRLDDSVLRSEISGAQVARQAEIARLEGRILQLEEQLRDLPTGSGSMQLAFILGFAPAPTVTTAEKKESAESDQGRDAIPHDSPAETRVAEANDHPGSAIQEIVVRDFVLSVEIELLDAQVRLLEKGREVKSLERLSSKGLASTAQLELQIMQRRRAELQVVRLEKQLAGLKRVYPAFFE